MVEIKADVYQEVPDAVAGPLEHFRDIIYAELPNTLPPRHAVDHRIELEPGAVVSANVRVGAQLANLWLVGSCRLYVK
ncbi:hypothetical protein F511_44719 [Dorcoceras hygrometricum]|uniref:Uncharacterized protein n=1 Tax=Dorcoceras hygrometricum TaxID=472368 RepID=A0A2Z6ZY18_9LAMI|nr:hypothetical protein F511_44719 [Dorcoceras hygrometricum]